MGDCLAVDGGTPVRRSTLPYARHEIDEADVAAVAAALRADWITSGPRVAEFEDAVARLAGVPHAIAVSSGTAALHTAVFAAGIGPDDEVVVPPLTFAATANAVVYQGGTPIFADIRPDTLNLDPAAASAAVTPRTRAIIGVDYAGQPGDLDALRELGRTRGLCVIEDAAHALGGAYRDRPVGVDADLAVFSFHPVKHATTGEGGAVTTANAGFAERARRFRNHGIASTPLDRRDWRYEMVDLGFNYRLTDIQCALGLSQLARLPQFATRRAAIARRYCAAFADVTGLTVPTVAAHVRHAWHLFPVLLDLDRLRVGRAEVFAALRAEGIGVNVHYIPVYWHPYYRDRGYRRGLCPVAEQAYERLLSLPIFPMMSDGDVDDVITAVAKVLGHYTR
jgi:perosamine synthetase